MPSDESEPEDLIERSGPGVVTRHVLPDGRSLSGCCDGCLRPPRKTCAYARRSVHLYGLSCRTGFISCEGVKEAAWTSLVVPANSAAVDILRTESGATMKFKGREGERGDRAGSAQDGRARRLAVWVVTCVVPAAIGQASRALVRWVWETIAFGD